MKGIAMTLTLATLGIAMTQMALANSTGHITISGTIVEDACRVNQHEEQMQVTCLSGSAQTSETVNVEQLARDASLELSHSQLSYRWIDTDHTMAIVTISHR